MRSSVVPTVQGLACGTLDGVVSIGQIIALLNEILDLFWPAA